MDGVKSPKQIVRREKAAAEEAKLHVPRIGATQSIRRSVHSFNSPKTQNSPSPNFNADSLKPVLMIVSGVSTHSIATKTKPTFQAEPVTGQRLNSHEVAKQHNSVSLSCSKLESADYVSDRATLK
jgi:hypothetical protein